AEEARKLAHDLLFRAACIEHFGGLAERGRDRVSARSHRIHGLGHAPAVSGGVHRALSRVSGAGPRPCIRWERAAMNRAQRAASLDELVAVKVMGDERRSGGAPPAYSTDMRHAWAVIRRLREMGWEHDLMVVADKHVVRFSRDGES